MDNTSLANMQLAERYFTLFVNRLAHTIQSHRPDEKGKHYYYRSKQNRQLTTETIRQHLNGQITVGIYALNPETQRSKWVAIDADYANAVDDLLKLQWESQFSVVAPRSALLVGCNDC